jgi:hypothetical protein
VLRTIIDGEIAAELARLRVSRKELLAEADLYPWVGEYPEVYEPLPLGVMFRARAVELMDYLVRDGSFSVAPTRLPDLLALAVEAWAAISRSRGS